VESSVSVALVVAQDAFALPLVPHAAEDCARVETHTETDEEGDQRDHNPRWAVALLP